MKICWDNLEKLKYNKNTGNWKKGHHIYIYMDSCISCNNPYLTVSNRMGDFCDRLCSKTKENHPMFGKKHSEKTKEKWSKKRKGKRSGNYKGGVTKKNIPFYDTYAPKIEYAEKVRRNKEDENILEVKCAYCGKWYIPKMTEVENRKQFLKGNYHKEYRLYCSDECKRECPIYNQNKFPKGYKKASSREVQPELRQMVFKRDGYVCQKCGDNKSLHCHHVEGIRWEPLESCDIDKCITYCKKCHKEVHKIEECRTVDMQCKERRRHG